MHNSSHTFIDVIGFLFREVQDVKGIVGEFQILIVINGRHGSFALTDEMIVVDVIAEMALGLDVRHGWLHQLVEDVVRSFHFLLEGNSRFL